MALSRPERLLTEPDSGFHKAGRGKGGDRKPVVSGMQGASVVGVLCRARALVRPTFFPLVFPLFPRREYRRHRVVVDYHPNGPASTICGVSLSTEQRYYFFGSLCSEDGSVGGGAERGFGGLEWRQIEEAFMIVVQK